MNTADLPKRPSINVFIPEGPADHVKHLNAMAKGMPGARILPLKNGYSPCDVAVIFGVGKRQVPASYDRGAIVYEHRFRERKPIIIIERGFIRRDRYYGAALDGLNGLGNFCNANSPPDRWKKLKTKIKPWRTGDYFLVCGQVPWDASVQHTNHTKWVQDTIKLVGGLTDVPVLFRPHPDVKGKVDYGVPERDTTWKQDLDGAKAVITFNSTSSAMAVLEGIPIFATDPGCIAWDIATHEITEETLAKPPMLDREQWAYNLAYSQWTAEEMETGQPWRQLAGQ